MHCTIDMEHAVPSALRAFAPLYVETVEKWRKTCSEIAEGRDDKVRKKDKQDIPPVKSGGQGPGFIRA